MRVTCLLQKPYEDFKLKFGKDNASMLLAATSTTGSSERHEPVRTCVVCRTSSCPEQLLELGLIGKDVVLTPVGKGRGAWVCATRNCLEKLDVRSVSRAFKTTVSLDALGDPVVFCRALAKRRVFEALGLARRQGLVAIGVDQTVSALSRNEKGVALAASDLSERSLRQLSAATVLGTCETIGQAMGLKRAGAVWIPAGGLAEKLGFWIRLLGELGFPEQDDVVESAIE